ncbi:MAG: FAD-dependent oxidoreductase [Planctomycetota bacterium]|jgi:hypothetical protein
MTIVNRNMIYEPDHIIVLDPTLVGPGITMGLKANGWILINSNKPIEEFCEQFHGYQIATIDATSIARKNKLGTVSVPIVNTALVGAFGKLLDFTLDEVNAALEHLGFLGGNLAAAKEALETVHTADAVAEAEVKKPSIPHNYIPGLVDGNTGELPRIHTGDWSTQMPHRVARRAVPPCNHVCPAGNDVQGFLEALAKDKVDEALEIILDTSPFPSVCGRVCPAPCMDMCNRIQLDGAVNVRELERYAGDHGTAEVRRAEKRDQKISVIGSGPAGLSAAYQLGRLGYDVTIFEGGPEIGGLLRTGIPPYRLPRDVTDREIERILDLGVKVETNRRIDKQALLGIANDCDAVLVATGLQQLRDLNLGSSEDGTVMQGIDFLDLANEEKIRVDGEEIVVAGGGNTAFDAARSSLRLGAKSVRIVYRRTRDEMPAIKEEIEEAIEEGIKIDYLTQPLSGGWTLICTAIGSSWPSASRRSSRSFPRGRRFTRTRTSLACWRRRCTRWAIWRRTTGR